MKNLLTKLTLLGLLILLTTFKSKAQVSLQIRIDEDFHPIYDSSTIVIINDLTTNDIITLTTNKLSINLDIDKAYRISFIRSNCLSQYIDVLTFYCDTDVQYKVSSNINLNKGDDEYSEFGGILYYNPESESFTAKFNR